MENGTETRTRAGNGRAVDREFDVLVLGATGVTGRLIVERLVELDRRAAGSAPARWAVAGRDEQRLADLLSDVSRPTVARVRADATDLPSLHAAAQRTRVLLNAAGPYTATAEAVIEACLLSGTSYVDLSGELPLLRRVNARFDARAQQAGLAVVQMAGWEALPADLVTLVAAHRATGGERTRSPDGPGAGGPVAAVHVAVTFTRLPRQRGLQESVSGGTVGSIASQLSDREAALIRDPAALLPPSGAAQQVREVSPLRMRPHLHEGRVIAPAVPVAFLNPPIVHRTAALLAARANCRHRPAAFQEGVDTGSARSGALLPQLRSIPGSVLQRGLLIAALLPLPVRRLLSAAATRAVPAGSGPTGASLTDWEWEVRADAVTHQGVERSAVLRGTGHPGYTATATMIVATALRLATTSHEVPAGCITPALVFGVAGAEALRDPELHLDHVVRDAGNGQVA